MNQFNGTRAEIARINQELEVARGSPSVFPPPSSENLFALRRITGPDYHVKPWHLLIQERTIAEDLELLKTVPLGIPFSVSFYTNDDARAYASLSFSNLEPLVQLLEPNKYWMSYGLRFILFNSAGQPLREPVVRSYPKKRATVESSWSISSLIRMPSEGRIRVVFDGSLTTGGYEIKPLLPKTGVPPQQETYHLAVNLFNQSDKQRVTRPIKNGQEADEKGKVVITFQQSTDGKLYPLFMHVVREWHIKDKEEKEE